jgi:hypothetical protein
MRFYNTQHQCYCGIDLHARAMYVCILNQSGEILGHRNMQTNPETFLNVIAPYREGLVVAVECMFTWDLAGRPVCSRRHPFRPRPCPVHEGHPWWEGQK